VFVDVGGTLCPNTWPMTPVLTERRSSSLGSALRTESTAARDLLAAIVEEVDEGLAVSLDEPADTLISRVLATHGFDSDTATAKRVRYALCLELHGLLTPFEHADYLLQGIKNLDLQCVILSNTTLRDAELYARASARSVGHHGLITA
jgi:FMN phosphatase YigB (HAD superfamily)